MIGWGSHMFECTVTTRVGCAAIRDSRTFECTVTTREGCAAIRDSRTFELPLLVADLRPLHPQAAPDFHVERDSRLPKSIFSLAAHSRVIFVSSTGSWTCAREYDTVVRLRNVQRGFHLLQESVPTFGWSCTTPFSEIAASSYRAPSLDSENWE